MARFATKKCPAPAPATRRTQRRRQHSTDPLSNSSELEAHGSICLETLPSRPLCCITCFLPRYTFMLTVNLVEAAST